MVSAEASAPLAGPSSRGALEAVLGLVRSAEVVVSSHSRGRERERVFALAHCSLTGRRCLALKRTYQPHNTRRKRTMGFLVRMSSRSGRNIIRNRRRKGRKRLAV